MQNEKENGVKGEEEEEDDLLVTCLNTVEEEGTKNGKRRKTS